MKNHKMEEEGHHPSDDPEAKRQSTVEMVTQPSPSDTVISVPGDNLELSDSDSSEDELNDVFEVSLRQMQAEAKPSQRQLKNNLTMMMSLQGGNANSLLYSSIPRLDASINRSMRLDYKDAYLLTKYPQATVPILHTSGELLGVKNVAMEIQAKADLMSFTTGKVVQRAFSFKSKSIPNDQMQNTNVGQYDLNSRILLDVAETAGIGIVSKFATSLQESGLFDISLGQDDGTKTQIHNHDAEHLKEFLINSLLHNTSHINTSFATGVGSHTSNAMWRCDTLKGSGFVVLASECNCVGNMTITPKSKSAQRLVMIGRLRRSSVISASDQSATKFVILVLCVPFSTSTPIPPTANALSTAHTFASLLTSDKFFSSAVNASNEMQFRKFVLDHVEHMQVRFDKWFHYKKKKANKGAKAASSFSHFDTQTDLDSNSASRSKASLSHAEEFAKKGNAAKRRLKRAQKSSLVWSKRCLGLWNDIKRLSKTYKKDWTDSVYPFKASDSLKLFSGTLWALFATLVPAISIGIVYNDITKGKIGITEMLIAEGGCSIVYALCGGQSLSVLRSTGPLLAYVKILYKWTQTAFGIEFLYFYKWTGIWLGILLILYSITEVSVLIKYCGRFTEEILAFMVSLVFIYSAFEDLADHIQNKNPVSYFPLFISTFLVAYMVNEFRKSPYITYFMREFISDLAPAISIVLVSAFSYIKPSTQNAIDRAPMPTTGGYFQTTTGRPWYIDSSSLSLPDIFVCLVPAFLVSLLFSIESNIGMLLTCRSEMKLRPGSPYLHLDMLVLGILVISCSLLGLPWCMISLPHSPMNVSVLADVLRDEHGHERILRARESRWPALISHAAIFLLAGLGSSWLAKIPVGVAMGFLLYMGIASLSDNQLFERLMFIFRDPNLYPPNHYVRFVNVLTIHKFTLIQIACFLFLWLLHDNFYAPALEELPFSIALLFPVVLAGMIPFKLYVLPLLFSKFDLEMLTNAEEDNIAKLVY